MKKFRLGVVGHKDTLKKVQGIVNEYFDEIEMKSEDFGNDHNISDAVKRVALMESVCDGILYSRKDPYLLISRWMRHNIPVRYVEIDSSDLLISLLRANLEYGTMPRSISIDGMDHLTAVKALSCIDISEDDLKIQIVESDLTQDQFVDNVLAQHVRCYKEGAELCITNITDVYRSLTELDIPATVIDPTTESFVHEIRNLMLRHRLNRQDANGVAILHMRLRYKDRYRFYGSMPIREIEELNDAAKLIAIFADKLEGAMFPISQWEYRIVCNQFLLHNTTKQFMEIDLMENINRDTAFDITIGMGCGQTLKEAESNAVLSSHQSDSFSGTNTVIAFSPEQVIGPLRPKSTYSASDSLVEIRLQEISLATEIGTNTLSKIYEATLAQNSSLFTSNELADILGVTTRTANRHLEKLIDNGYAEIIGKDLANPKGRPARVVRLLF